MIHKNELILEGREVDEYLKFKKDIDKFWFEQQDKIDANERGDLWWRGFFFGGIVAVLIVVIGIIVQNIDKII